MVAIPWPLRSYSCDKMVNIFNGYQEKPGMVHQAKEKDFEICQDLSGYAIMNLGEIKYK